MYFENPRKTKISSDDSCEKGVFTSLQVAVVAILSFPFVASGLSAGLKVDAGTYSSGRTKLCRVMWAQAVKYRFPSFSLPPLQSACSVMKPRVLVCGCHMPNMV